MTTQRYYVPALDGLRFFCFLMVFFHHRTPNLLSGLSEDQQAWWHGAVLGGAYGVTLFFALSAFLLTQLLQRERQEFGDIDVRSFYIRRALRIWPLYFFVLLLDAVLLPLAGRQPPHWDLVGWFSTFLANFKMLDRESIPMPTLVLWSVCVEEQFYLVWPWLNKKLSPLTLRICAWCMVLSAIGFRCAAAGAGWWWSAAWFHTLGHLDAFGFGALAVLELDRVKLRPMERNLVAFLPFVLAVLIGRYIPFAGIEAPISWWTALGFTFMPAGAALGVWAVSQIPQEQAEALGSPTIVRLGRITFGLYLYHATVNEVLPQVLPHLNWFIELLLRLAATVFVAGLSFRYFEAPILKLKRNFQRVPSGVA